MTGGPIFSATDTASKFTSSAPSRLESRMRDGRESLILFLPLRQTMLRLIASRKGRKAPQSP